MAGLSHYDNSVESTQRDSTIESSGAQHRLLPWVWALFISTYAALVYGGFVVGARAFWVTNTAWTIGSLMAAIGSFQAARAVTGYLHRTWFLFGLAFSSWFVGQLFWNWSELIEGRSISFPNISDLFYTAFGLLSIAAFWTLRTPLGSDGLTARNYGNLGLILFSLAVAITTALFEPIAQTQHSLGYIIVALAESLVIIVAFVLSVYFLWSHRWGNLTVPLILLVMGYAVHGAIALLYIHALIVSEYGVSHYLNFAWLVVFGFQHWASQDQVRIAKSTASISADIFATRDRRVEALLPGLLLLLLVIAAVTFRDHLTPRVLAIDATLLAVFAVVLLLRESWMYARERKLKSLLDRSNIEFEQAKIKLDRTLKELREAEEGLRLAASSGVGLLEWDLHTSRVRYSREWKRQLGYKNEEVGDELDEWQSRIHPDDYERALAAIKNMIEHPKNELQTETRLRHRDGHYIWILSQASLRFDRSGKPISLLGSQVDITRLKETEAALRESESRYRELAAQLEARVEERTAQLQDAYRELEGFAYAVSHDLKAPLRAIDGFSHLLIESAESKLSTVEREYVDRVRHGAMRMGALIDGLLAYSRVERRELHESTVELRALMDEVVAEHELELTKRDFTVVREIEPLILRVDREALLIALRNLFDNAVKFTREVEHPQISLRAYSTNAHAIIEVIDNGIGFDQAYHDQIFSIFQRLQRNEDYEGTGVGLALARKAVQRMNGRLWAQGVLDQGATFYVELPLRRSPLANNK
jgi:PAS domain S-box-containing protein